MRNKCLLSSANPTSTSSCISISSKPTQGPRNSNQPRPGSQPLKTHPSTSHLFIPLMVMFVFKYKVNVGRLFFLFYCSVSFDLVECVAMGGGMVKSWLKECANEHVSLCLNPGQALKRRLFTFRCWPPTTGFFFPPVFQSLRRHDPFKWLFTCIRRRAKALLNELLSTIQLEWPSQQLNFFHITQRNLLSRCCTCAIRSPNDSSDTCTHRSLVCCFASSSHITLYVIIY